ncbi:MAG: hypothetical protein IPK83_17560 [Planctomycetes bacterium]|nr:hypothetical protein [Planctomycetota bacterium]
MTDAKTVRELVFVEDAMSWLSNPGEEVNDHRLKHNQAKNQCDGGPHFRRVGAVKYFDAGRDYDDPCEDGRCPNKPGIFLAPDETQRANREFEAAFGTTPRVRAAQVVFTLWTTRQFADAHEAVCIGF